MNTALAEPDTAMFMDSGLRRDDEWGKALARFQQAQTILDSARSEPDEDAYDALLDSHTDALCALLALPAPDLAGIAAKLDVIVPQLTWALTGSEDCLEILRRDARRLAAAQLKWIRTKITKARRVRARFSPQAIPSAAQSRPRG